MHHVPVQDRKDPVRQDNSMKVPFADAPLFLANSGTSLARLSQKSTG